MGITRWKKYPLTKTGLFVYFLILVQSAFGQYHPVAKESGIVFTIHNFGFKVSGKLDPPEGDIWFNPDSLSKSFFHMTIKSESINTDNNTRDEHLKEEDYFDVKNFPLIRFVSDHIRATDKNGGFEATGTLTIKNKSREITLPFKAVKNENGWLFSGGFTMNRRDFGIGGSSTISNELTVDIKVLAR
jgi:polyisoprenoid-binding protein YceI